MSTWDAVETPLEIHQAAIEGLTLTAAAARLDVTDQTLRNWFKSKKSARRAWDHGQAARAGAVAEADDSKAFARYVFRQLPPDMQVLWSLAVGDDEMAPIDYSVSAGIISNATDYQRKYMYAHAMASTGWNKNLSMQVCGISFAELQRWQSTDEDFLNLMYQLEHFRKNYFEQQLQNLVARQDPASVMFVNKCINRDRGYGEQVNVKHTGTVTQDHTGTVTQNINMVALGNLNLPVDILRQVMEAIEAAGKREAKEVVTIKGVDGETYTLPPGVRP